MEGARGGCEGRHEAGEEEEYGVEGGGCAHDNGGLRVEVG
jgi:hypothetical protein